MATVSSTTTVQVRKDTVRLLNGHRNKRESMDDVVNRMVQMALTKEGTVFVDIIMIDGLYAKSASHEVVFQLGEDPPHYYRYINGEFEELPELPKINMVIEK